MEPTPTTSLEEFYAAAADGDTRKMAAYFTQPSATAAAREIETLLARDDAPPIVPPSSAHAWDFQTAYQLLSQELSQVRPWFNGNRRALSVIVHSPFTSVAWIFGPDSGLLRWLPRTLQLLLPFRLREAILKDDCDSLEALLSSALFVECYHDAQREAVLTTLSRALLSRHKLADDVIHVLLAHGASVEDLFVNDNPDDELDHSVLAPVVLAHGAWVVGNSDVFHSPQPRSHDSREAFVRAMVHAGADVRHVRNWHRALLWIDPRVTEVLLTEGFVDVDLRDPSTGFTPVMAVAASDPLEWASVYRVVELLVDHGADVNARSADGRTALHIAAGAHVRMPRAWLRSFHSENTVVSALLSSGRVDRDARDAASERTPLHLACAAIHANYCNFHVDAVVRLVMDGADLHPRDADGFTPLELVTRGVEGRTPWPRQRVLDLLKELVLVGADLRGVDLDAL